MLDAWVQLPYPPSLNKYYRTYQGRILISAPGRAYRRLIESTLCGGGGRVKIIASTPLELDISMELIIYPPDKRRRDVDNVLKALFDSLQYAGVYKNDYQIGELHLKRADPCKNGLVFIKLSELKKKAA